MTGAARPISARTSVCGIVLHPSGHTRSPAMHNAAFEQLGLDAVYAAFDVPPDSLPAALDGARALGMRQLAISIPHKERALTLLHEVDETARRIGAVNTATLREGRWWGHNTDWIGAVRALEREAPLRGLRAVVLGAGGAARAVVYGLLQRGAEVTVRNRSPERARELAASLGAQAWGDLESALGAPEVLVNTTSVGLGEDVSPIDPDSIPPGCLLLDAVYEPERTRLLREGEARGARTVPGKWMLVYQAAEQLRLWTGLEAPIEVMAEAFDRAGASGP